MTKSTITREQLEEWVAQFDEDGGCDATDRQLETLIRQSLAAMDSEPVAYISKSDFDAGYPHILARRDFNKACTMPVYAAQPTPVVPKSISVREAISALESEDAVTTIGQAYKIGWNACRAAMLQELKKSAGTEATCRSNENALVLNTIKAPPALGSLPKIVEVQNTNSPVNDVTTGKPLTNGDSVTCKSLTSINQAPALVSLPKNDKSLTGNSPVIPDGSEHCPCCGKKLRRACSVEGCDGNHVAHGLCQKHYDMKRWEDPEQVERFREAGRRYRGKKKTTVATPQEPKP